MRFTDREDSLDDWDEEKDLALPTRPRTRKRTKPAPPEPPPASRLKLRPLQQLIRDDKARFRTPVVHRRWGKTVMAIDWLVEVCEQCKLDNPRVYFLAPTYKAAKNIAWQMVRDLTAHVPGIKLNEWELSATFPANNAKLQLLSCVNFQRHRGIYADAVVFDEVPLLPPSAWTMVFRPALSDRLGRAMFIGTPAGRGWQYRLYLRGLDPEAEAWSSWLYTVDDTDIIDAAERADLQATMPSHEFRQEFLCDWNVAHRGAFFGRELNTMDELGRIREVAWEPELPVISSWFLPKTDSAVVAFFQQVGDQLHCIDTIWKQQTSIAELCKEVSAKPYEIDRHYAPARAQVDHYASRLSQARGMGLRFILSRELPLIDGIYASKPLLENMHIDLEHCEDFAEALRQYHATYDEVRQVYQEKPQEDWTGDFAGALNTLAAAHNPRRSDWTKPLIYPGRAA